MPIPKIEERTLYPPLVNYLKTIGFKAIGESKIIRKSPDIVFQFDSISFVIEVKIGKTEIGLKAVAQASDYARKLNTQNIIILVYPEKHRNEPITDDTVVEKIALDVDVYALVLTDYWTESLVIKPLNLFKKLKQRLISKEVKVDFNTTVELIGNYVKELNSIIYEKAKDELISEVVNKLDLFSSIGDLKDKETAEKQVKNLASYLLFNQLLFYHIYTKKDKTASLPELERIADIKDIQMYFNRITNIDYQSIYRVNILGHIPKSKIVIDTLNEVIKGIKLLRAENITQDLAGRFFHDLIPFEVRKVLAAFYTHPIAAEILANLTIDYWDEEVIDPACGSGTLLVNSYLRKQSLYQKLYGFRDNTEMHKRFIELDLTGIDIMPFAAHISAINLTMQNIEQRTNKVRIATLDSLELGESMKTMLFKRSGIEISPYSSSIQLTLDELYGEPITIEKKGAVSPIGKGSEFLLKPVKIVIMNPPFSDREKMPKDMREKLKINPLGEVCSHRINLWGYFLALADLLLKSNGKLGAVIPINIARGKATEKIRNFLMENYQIRYIVKPVGDLAFSEGSSFRDILFIAEKKKPRLKDLTKFIFLKKSIREMTSKNVRQIIKRIDIEQEFEDNDIVIRSYSYKELKSSQSNLMRFFSFKNKILLDLISKIDSSEKLKYIDKDSFPEGFHASPKGLSQLVFITNPISSDRVKRAFLIVKSEEKNNIKTEIKNTEKEIMIPKEFTYPALRSITGIKTIEINENDFFIHSEYLDINTVINLSKWDKKKPLKWEKIREEGERKRGFLLLPERFNPYSINTHLLAFVSKEKIIAPHTIRFGKSLNYDDSILQGLFLNSAMFFSQILINREETSGQYLHIMTADLILMKFFDLQNLSNSEKTELYKLYESIRNIEFPSLIEQFENRFKLRIKLDETILKILGFSIREIGDWLPKIYDSLIEELKIMKNVK